MASDPDDPAGEDRVIGDATDAQPAVEQDLEGSEPVDEDESIFLIDGDPNQFDDVLTGEVGSRRDRRSGRRPGVPSRAAGES